MSYLPQEINGVQFSTYHVLLLFFDVVEPHMIARVLLQFRQQLDILVSSVIGRIMLIARL